jgi:EF-hand domain pair
MSVSAAGSSSNAYWYLQSLLQQGGANSSNTVANDPISQLLSAFYPAGPSDPSSSATNSTNATTSTDATIPMASCMVCSGLSPDTMSALISMQSQDRTSAISANAQSLFSKLDTNGDGTVSKSEFESIFGSNADLSKVDGLFNALDSNSDGSISLDELTSAAQQAHALHHHHMHGGEQAQTNPSDLLSASGTSQTMTNADGSTTTTINYSDGSTVSMTTPAASSDSSGSGTQSSGTNGNILEQLIQYQAQLLAQSTNTMTSSLATI